MIRAAAAALLLAAAGQVQAEICYSPARAANVTQAPSNSTVFDCPQAGQRTLPQLARAGYVVIKLTPVVVAGPMGSFNTADQLLLRRSNLVFRTSFES